MSTGADNKSMPVSKEYEAGYERVYGNRKPTRGRFIWDDAQGKLVKAEDYRGPPEKSALHAPILSGRFYENTSATDGTDIGSRTKHREYLKRTGCTVSSDYREQWKKQAEQRAAARSGYVPSNTRREALERAFHKIQKP